MKKILFATTALVATAGYAAADVNITGAAEIGIVGGDAMETQFHTDVDVVFRMTGEADNGLTFGARVDLDESADQRGVDTDGSGDIDVIRANSAFDNDADDGGANFCVAFGGARLDMGDTDGALDAVMQEVALAGGSIAGNEDGHDGYNGNAHLDGSEDGQIARFSYTFDSFTGHVSVELDDSGANDPVWGVGVRYSAELSNLTLGVGLGYQTQSDVSDVWGLSIGTAFSNGLSAALNYSETDPDGANNNVTHWAVGFGYTMNALSIGVNYGEYDRDGAADSSGFGLAATYDLGGGLSAQLGYGNGETGDDDADNWSLGLAMSF